MRLIDAESALPTMPIELENQFMRRCQIKYKDARELILQARQELGMTKTEPWTEALKIKTEQLYEARYGKPVPPEVTAHHSGDNDSTTTPGTNQSYSFDISEDAAAANHGDHPVPTKSIRIPPMNNSKKANNNKGGPVDDPTEDVTEATVHDDTHHHGESDSGKKKKRGSLLKRVFRFRGGRKTTI